MITFEEFVKIYDSTGLTNKRVTRSGNAKVAKYLMENKITTYDEWFVDTLKWFREFLGVRDDTYSMEVGIPIEVYAKHGNEETERLVALYILGKVYYLTNMVIPEVKKIGLICIIEKYNKGTILKEANDSVNKLLCGFSKMSHHDTIEATTTINNAIEYICECIPYLSLEEVIKAANTINLEDYNAYEKKKKK